VTVIFSVWLRQAALLYNVRTPLGFLEWPLLSDCAFQVRRDTPALNQETEQVERVFTMWVVSLFNSIKTQDQDHEQGYEIEFQFFEVFTNSRKSVHNK